MLLAVPLLAAAPVHFRDATASSGIRFIHTDGSSGRRYIVETVTCGLGLMDYDGDGVPELFTAAGHLQDTVEQYDQSSTYRQRSLLLQQRGGHYLDVTAESGPGLAQPRVSRGAVFGDLNNDGRPDIVLLNARSQPTVLLNDTATKNHWTLLKLVGTRSNRSAVGAVARVTAGGRTWVDEVRAGRGYQSADDLRLHFGLGASAVIDRLEIRWPNG